MNCRLEFVRYRREGVAGIDNSIVLVVASRIGLRLAERPAGRQTTTIRKQYTVHYDNTITKTVSNYDNSPRYGKGFEKTES